VRAHRFAVLLTAVILFATLAARADAQAGRSDFGSVAVKTIPPDALIYIDGGRWVGPEATAVWSSSFRRAAT
jgi:hypothetical protein